MKLITFAIPCYNSEAYMEHAIDSLIPFIEDVEIIIVNDGSKDNTLKIAKKYKKKYPHDIKVIDKENGGHGSGVNAGLDNAEGLYYKVLDSDDWIDKKALKKVLSTIKKMQKKNNLVDMLIANYVYEKEDSPRVVDYKDVLPVNKIFTWNEVKKFKIGEYLLMHSVLYKTEILKDINLRLPHHTFYVDNIFVYYPLPHIKTMYYLDVDLYRYFIGRDDQSVNEKNMIKRIDQQLYVNKLMISFFDPYTYENTNPNLTKYLIHYIKIMMIVSTSFLSLDGSRIANKKKHELWQYLKENNYRLYKECRRTAPGLVALNNKLTKVGYKVSRRIFKFN